MTDETESLVLEILKNMQTTFTRMEDRFAGFEDQLNGFGSALLTLRIDVSTVRRDIQLARDEVWRRCVTSAAYAAMSNRSRPLWTSKTI